MGCGCKSGGNNFKIPEGNEEMEPKMGLNANDVVKWFVFILLTILSPIIAPPILIWALYKGIIKNERLDAILMFKAISQAAKTVIDKEAKNNEMKQMSEEEMMNLFSTLEVEELPIK